MAPEGWEHQSLKGLLTLEYGKSLAADSRKGGPIPVFGSNGIVGWHNEPLVRGPGIVVGRKGSVGEVVWSRSDFWPIDTTYFVKPTTKAVLAFLRHLLASLNLRRLNSATGIPGLNREDAYRLEVLSPPLGEQRKIAAILSAVDAAIEATQAVIDQLQVVKKAMMAELLTKGLPGRHTKFKQTEIGEVPDEWRVARVDECCVIRNQLRKPINTIERQRMPGPYPYYGPTKVIDHINEYRVDGQFALIGEDGDHFLKFERWPMTQLINGKSNVNNHAHIIQGTDDCLAVWFQRYFEHRDITPRLTRQGANRYKLKKETLAMLPLALPPPDEQKKISELFALVDDSARLERAVRSELSALKSSLMSVLLTGEVRVTPEATP